MWLDQVLHVWGTHVLVHFFLALGMGLLGFLPTLTILFALCSMVERLTHTTMKLGVVYGILITSMLVGMSFALLSHWGLDAFYTWYTTPLNPPLDYKGT